VRLLRQLDRRGGVMHRNPVDRGRSRKIAEHGGVDIAAGVYLNAKLRAVDLQPFDAILNKQGQRCELGANPLHRHHRGLGKALRRVDSQAFQFDAVAPTDRRPFNPDRHTELAGQVVDDDGADPRTGQPPRQADIGCRDDHDHQHRDTNQTLPPPPSDAARRPGFGGPGVRGDIAGVGHASGLDVEAEVDDVAVLNDVGLAF
jgi:hypothetical protein